jgi:hypothetical protein
MKISTWFAWPTVGWFQWSRPCHWYASCFLPSLSHGVANPCGTKSHCLCSSASIQQLSIVSKFASPKSPPELSPVIVSPDPFVCRSYLKRRCNCSIKHIVLRMLDVYSNIPSAFFHRSPTCNALIINNVCYE